MGYITDDISFTLAFWDRTWRPTEKLPKEVRDLLRRRLDVFTQPHLAQGGSVFHAAVNEQLSQMRRLRGISPIPGLMWEEVTRAFTDSLEAINSAYRRIRLGEGTVSDTAMYILFLIRLIEEWQRWGWPWPWDIRPPPRWAEEGLRKIRVEVIPLLPPPRR